MTTFTEPVQPLGPPDPTKHVNYTYGMVLGVDDFTQEFAYLEGQDQEASRELHGYGRIHGLAVTYEAEAGPPPNGRLLVSPGAASVPPGQLVVVDRTQCADVNAWLAANRDQVVQAQGGAPQSGRLALSVVLTYAACETDARPVPGEPCRSEDDLMAPSRLRDDFRLDLRFAATDESEVTALTAFVDWLRSVPVEESSTSTLDDLLDEVRIASGVTVTDGVPMPPVLGAFMTNPPPGTLSIPASDAPASHRRAFDLWATELLPCWRSPDEPGLTIALLALDVVYNPLDDTITADPGMAAAPGPVTQAGRPLLLHTQALQEWLFSAGVPAAVEAGPTVVAAGWFDVDGDASTAPLFASGGLTATRRAAPDDDVYDLAFTVFDATHHYIVTGTPVVAPGAPATHTVELVTVAAPQPPAVRVRRTVAQPANYEGFHVQVVRCP